MLKAISGRSTVRKAKRISRIFFFTIVRQPTVDHDILIAEVSRSDTPHLVGLLRTSDQPDTETSLPDNTRHSQQTDIHASGGIRTLNPSKRTVEDPHLRPLGQWALPFPAFYSFWCNSPHCARAPSFTRFVDHTRHTTIGRTPLAERSTRLRDFYLISYNTQNRHTPMPPVGFEPTISASEQPQTYALDRAATGTGFSDF